MIPFIILMIFNLLLLYKTTIKKKVQAAGTTSSSTKKKAMTITVMLVTLAFVVFTLPSAVISGYFFTSLFSFIPGRVVVYFCETLSFSYHSYNFFVLYALNKQFRQECKSIITKRLNAEVTISASKNLKK